MRFIILCVLYLSPIVLYSQYTSSDNKLLEDVYRRQLNKTVVMQYLTSENKQKIHAAICAVGQTADTVLFNELLRTLPEQYDSAVAVAAMLCGRSEATIQWIRTKVFKEHRFERVFLQALSLTGYQEDLNELLGFIASKKIATKDIGLSLFYFARNKITSSDAVVLLQSIVQNTQLTPTERIEALYTIYRIPGVSAISDYVVSILHSLKNGRAEGLESFSSSERSTFLAYAAGIARREKKQCSSVQLAATINNSINLFAQIELLKLLFRQPVASAEQVDGLKQFLHAKNGNIAVTAAEVFSLITCTDSTLLPYIRAVAEEALISSDDPIVQGELLQAILSHSVEKTETIKRFSNTVTLKYYSRAASKFLPSTLECYTYIMQHYLKASLEDKLAAGDYLFSCINNPQFGTQATQFILREMFSSNPAIAGNLAEKADSSFIKHHATALAKGMKSVISEKRNDPDYLETLMTFYTFLTYFPHQIASELREEFALSEQQPLRKLITGDQRILETPKYFELFLSNAFSFTGATISTSKGEIAIVFNSATTPISCGNFISLAREGFYDGVRFHRVVPGFVIQAGDPHYEGWGGPGYSIPSEFSYEEYKTGAMGMASAGRDTEGSQWFFMQGSHHHLNGRYSLFATLVSGLEIIEQITMNDRILSIRLHRK